MNSIAERLWSQLHPLMTASAGRVLLLNSTLHHSLGRSANDAFLLRVYSEFVTRDGECEVAVTVDMMVVGDHAKIESDVGLNDGTIIASGPRAKVPWPTAVVDFEDALTVWIIKFEQFLRQNESQIAKVASAKS